jgi:hypothetical protein
LRLNPTARAPACGIQASNIKNSASKSPSHKLSFIPPVRMPA